MAKTGLFPFLVSLLLYFAAGALWGVSGETPDVAALFSGFRLSPVLLLPALAIPALCVLRWNVKWTILVSGLLSVILALAVQGTDIWMLLSTILKGFQPENPALSALLSGGGIVSMWKVFCIVCISSSYAGLFRMTGLLERLQRTVSRLDAKIGSYGSTLAAAGLCALISCNQTLTILLTHQLRRASGGDGTELASNLEDTAVVVAPLIPWSIAAAVPLASVSAPSASIFAAWFLYLLPLWRLLSGCFARRTQHVRG